MNWLRDLPIRRKLTLVILLTCSLVLLLACGVLALYQVLNFRQGMVRDTTVLANVLAKNTQAALTFQDEILGAIREHLGPGARVITLPGKNSREAATR